MQQLAVTRQRKDVVNGEVETAREGNRKTRDDLAAMTKRLEESSREFLRHLEGEIRVLEKKIEEQTKSMFVCFHMVVFRSLLLVLACSSLVFCF